MRTGAAQQHGGGLPGQSPKGRSHLGSFIVTGFIYFIPGWRTSGALWGSVKWQSSKWVKDGFPCCVYNSCRMCEVLVWREQPGAGVPARGEYTGTVSGS